MMPLAKPELHTHQRNLLASNSWVLGLKLYVITLDTNLCTLIKKQNYMASFLVLEEYFLFAEKYISASLRKRYEMDLLSEPVNDS